MSALGGAYVTLQGLLETASTTRIVENQSQRTGHQVGHTLSKVRGRGLDLDEVRQYQPGDDVRSIDWKVTARKVKPHTKVYREERERPVLLVIDQRHSMFFGSTKRMKSVLAAELAARLAWFTLANRDRVGGLVLSIDEVKVVKPKRSRQNVARLLHEITEANCALNASSRPTESANSIWQLLPLQINRLASLNHRLIFISDFADLQDTVLQQLLALRIYHNIELMHVYDGLETELPPANMYSVSDGQKLLTFDARRRVDRERFAARASQRIQHLADQCTPVGRAVSIVPNRCRSELISRV